jgi:hypothetical protein
MDESKKDAEESWSGVESAANNADATLIVGFLESHDIPARVVDRSFHEMPTVGDDLSPIEIAVPTDRLEEARQVLARRDEAFAASPEGAEGSESVLTDEGPAEVDESAETDSGKPPASR